MEDIRPGDFKTILHSKRANLFYLEHCRVLVNGGRVEYVTERGKQQLYWNIPIANTTTVLLGTGTSVTQAAVRELAKAGVMLGFCGGGGTPLFAGDDSRLEVAWFSPQSEYRPTEYLQRWVGFWFDETRRLVAAKSLQRARLDFISRHWLDARGVASRGFGVPQEELRSVLAPTAASMASAAAVTDLLATEAVLTKRLYRLATNAVGHGEFLRAKNGEGTDPTNGFLDHGNYLAYGLGATAAWVLGLPHGLAVLHGKTRRGGLVFDIADLVKDALVLPQAFVSAMAGHTEQQFRQACIDSFARAEALDFMIDAVKLAATLGAAAEGISPSPGATA